MPFTDTHAHLYLDEFSHDLEQVILRAKENHVHKILLPNIDETTIIPLKQVVFRYPDIFIPMMGLHPCSVKENVNDVLPIIKKELYEGTYVAVGEIGIDLYWDKTTYPFQEKAFTEQCLWAMELNLPVVIHCRESIDETIRLVKDVQRQSGKKLRGVFHCFTGTLEQAQELIQMEFYLGIGGVVTFKNGKIDAYLHQIPLQFILLETDSPYLAPVPHRGKRNEPSYIKLVAEKLSSVYQISVEEIENITTQNAKALMGF